MAENILINETKEDPWLEYLRELITKLRNREDTDENFQVFHDIIEERGFFILETWNLRWLVSICDTYADYGNAIALILKKDTLNANISKQ